jgi:hypothetical protein
LSCNLETLTSWNPLGHSRPVTGLLYLLHKDIDIDIVADIKKEEIGVDWTCSRNGTGKDS